MDLQHVLWPSMTLTKHLVNLIVGGLCYYSIQLTQSGSHANICRIGYLRHEDTAGGLVQELCETVKMDGSMDKFSFTHFSKAELIFSRFHPGFTSTPPT